MKGRRTYSGSFKFKVVMELLKGEKPLVELAQKYEIHPNQIKNWKSVFLKRGSEILEDRRKRRREDMGRDP